MSDAAKPLPYVVTYSDRAREKLLTLADEARLRGDGAGFVSAVREFDRRLRIYPQFGDPLWGLNEQEGHIRLGIVPPLAMRYGVFEKTRQVFVVANPVLLAKAGAC